MIHNHKILHHTFAIFIAISVTLGVILMGDIVKKYAIYSHSGIFLISIVGNATVLFSVPSFAIVFSVGGTLNPYIVGLTAGCGSAIGEMTGFLAGYGGKVLIREKDKKIYDKMVILMNKWGGLVMLILAIIPNPVFDIGGILAGGTRMSWYKFWMTAAIGKSIRYIIIALFGVIFII